MAVLKMQRLEGVVTHMQQNIKNIFPTTIHFESLQKKKPRAPFCKDTTEFLNQVSKKILSQRSKHSDVSTFGFWCRRGNIEKIKNLHQEENLIKKARGVIFHIAPSNVPVNFAFSTVIGLLTGNINIIRVPSKNFEQINEIIEAFRETCLLPKFTHFKDYINFIRYEKSQDVNTYLSQLCDVRIIWGGDRSVSEIRKSNLPPRSFDITFANRVSYAIISAKSYLNEAQKDNLVKAFYNDTYLFDQNACTSPKLVIWLGTHLDIEKSKKDFWKRIHNLIKKDYTFGAKQALDKLLDICSIAINDDIKIKTSFDNFLVRYDLKTYHKNTFIGNSGLFGEIETDSLEKILPLFSKKVQTLSYFGIEKREFINFVEENNFYGVDRIVPLGKSMDFSHIWDGFNLLESLTRNIQIV